MDPNQAQPYAQPFPQQYQAPPARPIPFSRAWHTTKIVLYSFAIVFSLIVLGISIALLVDPSVESIQIIWVAPQAGVGLCWSVAELITICARGGKRGIHPGAHVALHLLLWLGFAAAAGLTAWLIAFAVECDYYCQNYGDDYGYSSSSYVRSMEALAAFLALLVLIHFVLFVRACVETNQRNRMAGPVVMVPSDMYYQHYTQQPAQPMPAAQAGYPMQPQPQHAHQSGYYDQQKPVQTHMTGSTNVSQPAAPMQVQNHELHADNHYQ